MIHSEAFAILMVFLIPLGGLIGIRCGELDELNKEKQFFEVYDDKNTTVDVVIEEMGDTKIKEIPKFPFSNYEPGDQVNTIDILGKEYVAPTYFTLLKIFQIIGIIISIACLIICILLYTKVTIIIISYILLHFLWLLWMIIYFKWSSSFKSHNWFIDDTVAIFLPVLIICSI